MDRSNHLNLLQTVLLIAICKGIISRMVDKVKLCMCCSEIWNKGALYCGASQSPPSLQFSGLVSLHLTLNGAIHLC